MKMQLHIHIDLIYTYAYIYIFQIYFKLLRHLNHFQYLLLTKCMTLHLYPKLSQIRNQPASPQIAENSHICGLPKKNQPQKYIKTKS